MRKTKVHLSQRQIWSVYQNQKLYGTFAACGSAFGDTSPRIDKVTCGNCRKIIAKVQRQFCKGC